MNAWDLARRFLRWRAVATLMSVMSISLSVGLVASLRAIPAALRQGAVAPADGVPILVGVGDSSSRLLFAALFLEPPELPDLPTDVLRRVTSSPGVLQVAPLRIRHGTDGPLVSTSRAYFRMRQGAVHLREGRFFRDDEGDAVVVGSAVARDQRLRAGASLVEGSRRATVVGVLEVTGTAVDRTVFLPLGSDETAISAIFVVPSAPSDGEALRRDLAAPGANVIDVEAALRRIVRMVSAVDEIVSWLSVAIVVLVFALVLATFYSSVRERLRDLAVLRAIGARRRTLVLVLALESAVIGFAGAALGLVLAQVLVELAGSSLSGIGYGFAPRLGWDAIMVGVAALGTTIGAGVVTSLSAYQIDPVQALSGVHRPWREIIAPRSFSDLRRLVFFLLVLFVTYLPTAMDMGQAGRRMPGVQAYPIFNALRNWDGDGPKPPAVADLEGTHVELEGYQYVPFAPGKAAWHSAFFLVADDPNKPAELFHEDAPQPARNERILVELNEPIEATLHVVRVRGTLTIKAERTPLGEALYHLKGARAEVVALDVD
ncbi:FtsX-like permease family protein [Sorangium sp. So ce295]|uniref:FtsX-like permease family protein n=1 Tax=Sorangium sp. So ce295 TaxID=3133295 RepID=UPI003F5DB3A3